MIFFRHNENWLKHRVSSKIISAHPGVINTTWRKNINAFSKYLTGREGWKIIPFLVYIFVLLFPIVNIEFFNIFTVEPKTAEIIVDQRASNIATIISITLAIVGFLIGNIAVKEGYTYRLLFKYSYFFPIVYLILSTISVFIILSTLRDSIPEFEFSRAVLGGTYCAVVILVLIGFLFRKLVLFTDNKEIRNILEKELLIEAKENLLNALIIKYSKQIFVSAVRTAGAKEYSWLEAMGKGGNFQIEEVREENITKIEEEQLVVVDINLSTLTTFINENKSKGTIFYSECYLNAVVSNKEDIVWLSNNNNELKNSSAIKNSFLTKSKNGGEKDTHKVRKYFDQKLEEWSEENKYKNVENILESYFKLYQLQMQNQK